jgi:hypothetical protein
MPMSFAPRWSAPFTNRATPPSRLVAPGNNTSRLGQPQIPEQLPHPRSTLESRHRARGGHVPDARTDIHVSARRTAVQRPGRIEAQDRIEQAQEAVAQIVDGHADQPGLAQDPSVIGQRRHRHIKPSARAEQVDSGSTQADEGGPQLEFSREPTWSPSADTGTSPSAMSRPALAWPTPASTGAGATSKPCSSR